jgi:ABC-2 type transport system permease protein
MTTWAIRDTGTIVGRHLAHWAREPAIVIFGVGFSVMFLLLFGYLLGGQMAVPGGGDYKEFLVPGIAAMTMMFGLEGTMVAIREDAEKGITDRFRSMPMARSAVVLGRCVADLLNTSVGLAGLLLCGLLIGWRAHGSVAETVLAIGLLVLLRFSMLWVGILLGLVIRSSDMVALVQLLIFPIGFLSNVLAMPESMPDWLGFVSEWNPLSSTAAASRELFGNPGWGGSSWAAEHAVLLALAWPLAITAVFSPLAIHRYWRMSR